MSATTDSVYLNAVAVLNRVASLATFDQYTPIGAAFWHTRNHLAIIRGDEGTAEQRAVLVGADGELTPMMREGLAGWTAQLNSAFPVTAAATTNGNGTVAAPPILVQEGGILDGEIFGVNKKLLLAGAVLFFFLKGK